MNFSIDISFLKKWITDYFPLAVVFLLLTIIIVVIATFLSYCTFLIFENSTQNSTLVNITSFVSQNSSDFISIFVNTMLTLGLIIFAALSLSSAQDALKQSQKQQEQFQDEQRIRDIEKRLEFFYMPAQSIMKVAEEFLKNPTEYTKSTEEVSSHKRWDDNQDTTPEESAYAYTVKKLKSIEQYRFLAKKETCKSFMKYVYGDENKENREKFSINVQTDIEDYFEMLCELKQEE